MNAEVRSEVGTIDLCLSGGGYRAVAFHLGTLSYLDHVGLRENVRGLSTVSGGTFIGAKYVLSLMEGVAFDDFFRDYWKYLEKTDVMGMGFDGLDGPRPETYSGRHHLIACMARAHAQTSMKDSSGRPYLFGELLAADLPFDEIVFNATELRKGGVFRFGKSNDPTHYSGTDALPLSPEHLSKVRMADIVAASSCFPGAFEPFAFPDDFVWPNREPPAELRKQFSRNGEPAPVLLVDGCVADNPGIESLFELHGEHAEKRGIFLISDVDPRVEELCTYIPPGQDGGPTLEKLALYARILLATWLLSVAAFGALLLWWAGKDGYQPTDVALAVAPLLMSAAVAVGILWVNRTIKRLVTSSLPTVGSKIWGHLVKTRLHQFLDMMKLRFGTMLKVSELVYPTRIRSLVYSLLDTHPVFRKKYVTNLLCELTSGYPWPKEMPAHVSRPTTALTQVVDVAEAVPITLWFDTPEQLPCLVAAGQADMCFNMMGWVVNNHGADPEAYSPAMRQLWDQLVADWKVLNENPYVLLEKWLPEEQLVRPKPGAVAGGHHAARGLEPRSGDR